MSDGMTDNRSQPDKPAGVCNEVLKLRGAQAIPRTCAVHGLLRCPKPIDHYTEAPAVFDYGPPTVAERELLTMLMEECGEVIQAAAKVLRHGWNSYHPEKGPMSLDNRGMLESELLDIEAVKILMREHRPTFGVFSTSERLARAEKKLRYTHHQGDATTKKTTEYLNDR